MSGLEKDIEYIVSRFASENGCLVLKLNVTGRRGWPDRLLLRNGKVLFIEFKRPGEIPRKLQEHIHAVIRAHQFQVTVVDSVEQGREAVLRFTQDLPLV